MNKKVVAMGSKDMVMGFTLAGVDEGFTPENDYEAMKKFDQLLESPDVGVVLISESTAEEIREHIKKKRMEKELYPVIVEVPDKEGPVEDKEDPLKRKIRRAVGIDITSMEES